MESLVIIIVDVCYSGQWVTYFQHHNKSLKRTKIIVQTASDDKVFYGNLFMPLWIELQNLGDIQALQLVSPDADLGLKQNPLLHCDPRITYEDINGVREIKQGDNTFRFFIKNDLFQRFCADYANKSIGGERGGTRQEIEEMKWAFEDGSITIMCFWLKIFGKNRKDKFSETPMALVLVEWLRARQRLHLHLHFKRSSNFELLK